MNTPAHRSRAASGCTPRRAEAPGREPLAAGILKKGLTRLPGAARRFPACCWGIQITGRSWWQCSGGWSSACVTMATWSQASSAASENLHPFMPSQGLTRGGGGREASQDRVSPHSRSSLYSGAPPAGVPRVQARRCGGRGRGAACGAASLLPRDPWSCRRPRLSL